MRLSGSTKRARRSAWRHSAVAAVGTLSIVGGVLLAPAVQAAPVTAATAPTAASVSQCWNPNSQYSATDPFVFGGIRLSAGQITAAQTISDLATARHLTDRAVRIAVAAAMSTSGLDPQFRNGSAVGLFAQQPNAVAGAAPLLTDRSDPAAATRAFFEQLTVQAPGYQSDPRTDAEIAALVLGRAAKARVARYSALATQLTGVVSADPGTSSSRIATLTHRLVLAATERSVSPPAMAIGVVQQTLTVLLGNVLGGLIMAPPVAAAPQAPTARPAATDSAATAESETAGRNQPGYRLRGAPALADADTAGSDSVGSDAADSSGGSTAAGSDGSGSGDGSSSGTGTADAPGGGTAVATTVIRTVITTLTEIITVVHVVDRSGRAVTSSASTSTATALSTSTATTTSTVTATPAPTDTTTTVDDSTTVSAAPSTIDSTTTTTTGPPTTKSTPKTTSTSTTPKTGSSVTSSSTSSRPGAPTSAPTTSTRATPTTTEPAPSTSTTIPPTTSTSGSAPSSRSESGGTTDHGPSAKPPTKAPPSDDPANPDPKEQQPEFPSDPSVTPDPVDPRSAAVPAGTPATSVSNCLPAGGSPSQFDPGSIISDQVFYNTAAMTTAQITSFVNRLGAGCAGSWCLRSMTVQVPPLAQNRYCDAYAGGRQSAAQAIAGISAACGINPQVMLVTLQKEAGLLTRTDVSQASWNAAWGWHCPDTGPGGSANCDPAHAGFVNQLYGMAQQWSRYKLDPGKYHYRAGQVADVMWNVKESGCGSSPVYIRNAATASLYNYTPYQPNAASLAAYPAAGDKCSSYGNRNFFVLFGKYFGGTGAGIAATASVSGTVITIPSGPNVDAGAAGQRIVAPNAGVARGIAAGLASVGLPYVWGGGTDGGGPDQGCSRAGGSSNSCQGIVGFDCSGLTAFVLNQAGFSTGTDSASQRAGGQRISWDRAQPGDIIGYPGHVSIFLGWINGVPYMLQAPSVGKQVQVRTVYTHNIDPVVHRYWR